MSTLRVLAHQLLRDLSFPNEVLKDLEKSGPGKISCRDGWRQFERRKLLQNDLSLMMNSDDVIELFSS